MTAKGLPLTLPGGIRLDSKIVLIIEDDADIREGMGILFGEEGYTVLTAGNGEEALRVLEQGPRPSVILMDLFMPGMDGWHFHHLLKNDPAYASIPIVAVTASSPKTQPPGGIEMLRKPIDLEKLLATVNRHCLAS